MTGIAESVGDVVSPGRSARRARAKTHVPTAFVVALLACAPRAAADPPAHAPATPAASTSGPLAPAASPPAKQAPPPKKTTPADRDAARALAEQGFEKLQQHKYSEAIALFTQAEERFHAPTHLAFIAQAHEKRGDLIEAAEAYRALLAEALPKDAPQPFRDAQTAAGPALEAIVRRIPKLRVDVAGEGAERARVTAQDRAVTPGVASDVNPGAVLVQLTGDGLPPLERRLVMPESTAEISVRFDLSRSYSLAWPVTALALGLVGGGVAIGTGITSENLAASARSICAGMVDCPPSQQDLATSRAAEATTLRNVTIGAGVAGGVLLATGVTLLLVRRGPRSTVDPPSAIAPDTVAFVASPFFTGVAGSF